MDTVSLQRFRENLVRQKQNLMDWMLGTPAEKKEICLGPLAAGEVQCRIDKLEEAIEKTNEQTFGLCTVCHEDVNTPQLEMDFTATVCLDHYSEDQKRRLEADLEYRGRRS